MTAYACRPGACSEPGAGWNWPVHVAALGHVVHVVVPSSARTAVEDELDARPRERLVFHYVPVPAWPLRLGWSLGSALQYVLWQRAVAVTARRLQAERPFDLTHHVSFGSLLGGSRLWTVGPPLVFGPTGGGQTAPRAFARYFGPYWRTEALRTFLVRRLWRAFVGARRCAGHSALVLAGNRETALLARRLGAGRVEPMPDVALEPGFFVDRPPSRPLGERLELVWVGRVLPRKALDLALDVVERCAEEFPVMLTVIGDDYPSQPVIDHERLARLRHCVRWRGTLPREEVRTAYLAADALLFTSLRDSCGPQLLEAMACALPIVTLDHQGGAVLVPQEAGFRVPVTDPERTVADMVAAVRRLAGDAGLRARMGEAALAAARPHTWRRRAQAVAGRYASLAEVAGGPRMDPERLAQARRWDDFTGERYAQIERLLPAAVGTVLDAGAGSGWGGAVLKRARPHLRIVGLDVDAARVAALPAHAYEQGICANACAADLGARSFDAVIAAEFLEHVVERDVDACLRAFHRCLRPDGVLVVTTPNPNGIQLRLSGRSVLGGAHLSQHEPQRLVRRARRAGFQLVCLRGSGRVTRLVGELVPFLPLYNSYLAVFRTPG